MARGRTSGLPHRHRLENGSRPPGRVGWRSHRASPSGITPSGFSGTLCAPRTRGPVHLATSVEHVLQNRRAVAGRAFRDV
jgi:hypothetical protein